MIIGRRFQAILLTSLPHWHPVFLRINAVGTMGVLVNTATVEPPPTKIDPVLSNNTAINPTSPPVTAAPVSISGSVLRADGIGVSNAIVVLTDMHGSSIYARTSPFGYYHFYNVSSGESYLLAASEKQMNFPARLINVNGAMDDLDFVAR